MTISEKINMFEQLAEELKADVDKADDCDCELKDLFLSSRALAKDAAGNLRAALSRIDEIKNKAAKTAAAFTNL